MDNKHLSPSDSALPNTDPRLLPQTITTKIDRGWFITQVNFFDAPAFVIEITSLREGAFHEVISS
jgi:hypothetical protein